MTSNTCLTPERAVLALALVVATFACVGEGGMSVQNVWSRPASAGGVGVAYLLIHNETSVDDRLLGVTSEVCETAELHRTEVIDDRMAMRHIEAGVEIAAGESLEFAPGDYHIMLIGLRHSLAAGSKFTLSLEFEHAGVIAVETEVR